MSFNAPPAGRLALLLARLAQHHGLVFLDEASLEAFVQAPGPALLFFPEDPERIPESWDVAAVLPDLLKHLPEPCRAGVIAPDPGRPPHARYGCKRWPALVFLREGAWLGAIEGMRDWAEFLAEARRILAGPARRPPVAIAILVTSAEASCR